MLFASISVVCSTYTMVRCPNWGTCPASGDVLALQDLLGDGIGHVQGG